MERTLSIGGRNLTVSNDTSLFLCLFFIILPVILCLPGLLWADSWERVTPLGSVPSARSGHSMVVINDKVYLYGGETVSENSSDTVVREGLCLDLYRFMEESDEWIQITPNNSPPKARKNHGAAAYGEKMFIFFGVGDQGYPLGDIWAYDVVKNQWEEVITQGTKQPTPTGGLSVVAANGRFYPFGGKDRYGNVYSDLWSLDLRSNTWNQEPSHTLPSQGHTAVANDATMYVYGGDNGQLVHNHLLSYDFATKVWKTVSTGGDVPAGRTTHIATLDANKIRISGGRGQTEELGDTWEYDIVSNQWVRKADGPVQSRSAAVVLPTSSSSAMSRAASQEVNHILMFGGERNGLFLDEMWEYFPVPGTPIVSGKTQTKDTTPTWKWTSGGGGIGKYRYKLDNKNLSRGATVTRRTSYTPANELTAGRHTLYVQERDAVGNWSASGKKTTRIVVDVTHTLPVDNSDIECR